MALVVEDGTGLANAESYISVADAVTYLTNRGDTTFADADTDPQEAALRNATDFMVSVYRYRWAGYRFSVTQLLDWPRSYVPVTDASFLGYGGFPPYVAFNIVPLQVAQACADLALRALSGDLAPDVERLERSVQVGPIKVEYDPYQSPATTYVAVINKLAPFLSGQGQRTSLVRT